MTGPTDNGKEILSMNKVLSYFIRSRSLLVEPENLQEYLAMSPKNWQRYAEEFKEMIATKPGMRPNAVRVDQLDRDQLEPGKTTFPAIVHFVLRPPQLSYAGNPEYQITWREYVK
ncbi:ribonuclease 3-like isoform X1 [Artemia franciscana]|uniref:ribonuclease 3-like isoform X1 n=1 Tax=Artemia franciscana TaxID=6661 RepID=UPI0032D9FF6C